VGNDDFAEPGEAGDTITEEEFAELEAQRERRRFQLSTHSGLRASTGIFRTQYAGSGPVGTFRFGVLGSYFGTERYLCPQCADPNGGDPSVADRVSRVGAHVQLSATPLEFLEAYLGIHSTATSNDRGDPELLQVLGDTTWGVKAFMPAVPDRVFSAGGALEMWMLNGTGGVGIDGSSFALRGLTTFDLSNTASAEDRTPLRFNFSLSYVFDNSGILVRDIENDRNRRITRIERYGLNVSRLDRFVPAFGIEGMFEVVRPYLEWSVDVPSNRQDYVCLQNDVHASDTCLDDNPSFTATPSRFTLGARINALLDGLALHAALDIGTGGMKPPFWEEVQPETPWNLHFGIAYAADTKPRVERVKVASEAPALPEAAPPALRYVVEGVVAEAGGDNVVGDAVLRYEGRSLTGMVTDDQGGFRTVELQPGEYTLSITAPGYQPGTCRFSVAASAAADAGAPAALAATESGGVGVSATAPPLAPPPETGTADDGLRITRARCELDPKPKVGGLEVSVVDAESGAPVPGAAVVPSSADGRSITLTADADGDTAVEGVPAGKITLRISAEGYYPTTRAIEIVSEQSTTSRVELHKAGRSNFTVGASAITMRRPIAFSPGSAELLPESRALLDELAALLEQKPELSIEIQSHSDNAQPFQAALTMTTDRATAIRKALVANGIDAGRVAAKGFGGGNPIVPNTSDRNKAKNDRIELVVRGGGN
jgi:outer membrane protein OmpA-like peptidoglycan-associated protein